VIKLSVTIIVADYAGTYRSRSTLTGRELAMFTVETSVGKSGLVGVFLRSSNTLCYVLRRQGGICIVVENNATTDWKQKGG